MQNNVGLKKQTYTTNKFLDVKKLKWSMPLPLIETVQTQQNQRWRENPTRQKYHKNHKVNSLCLYHVFYVLKVTSNMQR